MVRKVLQGSPPPPSALPGAPSIAEVSLLAPCDAALSPRSPGAVPSSIPLGRPRSPGRLC